MDSEIALATFLREKCAIDCKEEEKKSESKCLNLDEILTDSIKAEFSKIAFNEIVEKAPNLAMMALARIEH